MLRMIINADDCGFSKEVNGVIERAIVQKKITSTTIMASMDDFDGAIRLYRDYHDSISFGVHLNLTEGSPMIYNQELLDIGFYKETDSGVSFNGKAFQNKILSKRCAASVKKEILTQIGKIRDNGVAISHIDSHHHIHKSLMMMSILPDICNETGLYKVRNVHNYIPFRKDTIVRKAWTLSYKVRVPSIIFTDWFCSYSDFLNMSGKRMYKDNDTIELMCHPGGYKPEEDSLLFSNDPEVLFKARLINYNQFERK